MKLTGFLLAGPLVVWASFASAEAPAATQKNVTAPAQGAGEAKFVVEKGTSTVVHPDGVLMKDRTKQVK